MVYIDDYHEWLCTEQEKCLKEAELCGKVANKARTQKQRQIWTREADNQMKRFSALTDALTHYEKYVQELMERFYAGELEG